ncbi:hypothetical protein [Iodobacter sp.]|uniref:hypothetical protein n=1 Tax=Iodobacter sp. TaxID=1915058 RepID=UPI0025DCBF85|nr:hypothetical protein [Iodobacter sp.]
MWLIQLILGLGLLGLSTHYAELPSHSLIDLCLNSALAYLLLLWGFGREKAQGQMPALVSGFGLLLGSSIASYERYAAGSFWLFALWLMMFLLLLITVMNLGWIMRGRPDASPTTVENSAEVVMSAAEQREWDISVAEVARRAALTPEQRVSEDLTKEEADILARAEEIRQQTPAQRAEKIRAALAREEAQNAADKWMRE